MTGGCFADTSISDEKISVFKTKKARNMIVAANWKMNPTLDQAGVLATALTTHTFANVTRVLFAPHPYLVSMSVRLSDSGVRIGGQDCHFADDGAYTGDVSAAMLRDKDVEKQNNTPLEWQHFRWVILGL